MTEIDPTPAPSPNSGRGEKSPSVAQSALDVTLNHFSLSQGAWLINRVDVNFAAKMLKIDATWDEDQPFQLIFRNFHLISWQILEDEYDPGTVNVDVIGMEFGEDAHRKPAILTTDRFEIFVSYGELEIVKVLN